MYRERSRDDTERRHGSARYGRFTKDTIVDGMLYLRAWYALPFNRWCNFEVHHVMRNDSADSLHCHPYSFGAITLSGSAYEKMKALLELVVRRMPRLRYYPAATLHVIHDVREPLWTICINGPRRRIWGFEYPDGRWYPYQDIRAGTQWSNDPNNRLVRPVGCPRRLSPLKWLDRQCDREGRTIKGVDHNGRLYWTRQGQYA